ncbi:MAG TPA: VOC family protein [Dehalococcoidia bacterium]|nr:VOC family protein [Dehalococcoidia bacterium]
MATIQHIAIRARDNEKLAEFYKTAFGLTEVFRQPAGKDHVAYYLSDGHINVALLPCGPETPEGIDHFGFQVESMADATDAAVGAGASQGRSGVPRDGRFAEAFVRDPVGTRIDLSVEGWATVPMTAEQAQARLEGASVAPRIEA